MFKVVVGSLLVIVAALGTWMRFRQRRRRALALEAVVAERTRELRAEHDELQRALRELHAAKAELEATHTRLLTAFNQLRIGVLVLDPALRVRFASDAMRRLVGGAAPETVIGQPLARVLPVGAETLAAIQAQIRAPQPGVRITSELTPASGQRYWAEIEVLPDPGDEPQRVLYLYDVTETFALARAPHTDASPAGAKLLGDSLVMRALRNEMATVASFDATVLIEGETGTGKELVARAVHAASRRKHKPFIAINCGGLTESILASQLFGHRRGAFTGAVTDQVGLFEAAQGGTLLLDEIGDMPMGVQTHLLRVLQEREILRLGDSRPRPIDVRLLAATHRDLEREVAAGRFREDLFYRIRVVRLRVPPLRLRGDDIPQLATAFLRQACDTHGVRVEGISREAMAFLQSHPWPGNVRELKATIEGAVVRATGPLLKASDVQAKVPLNAAPPRGSLSAHERRLLLDALRQTGGNRKAAARLLGVGRSTLYRRLALLEAEGTALPPDTSPSAPALDD